MKKYPAILALFGAAILVIGLILRLSGGPPRADAASIARCEERMRDQGADMMARCQESAFATAMTATDANAAALAISNANRSEIGGTMLSMALIGFGLALTVFGTIAVLRQRRGGL